MAEGRLKQLEETNQKMLCELESARGQAAEAADLREELSRVKKEHEKAEAQIAKLIGQQNLAQRIKHTQDMKKEINVLKEQLLRERQERVRFMQAYGQQPDASLLNAIRRLEKERKEQEDNNLPPPPPPAAAVGMHSPLPPTSPDSTSQLMPPVPSHHHPSNPGPRRETDARTGSTRYNLRSKRSHSQAPTPKG
mmetsp:Transcript_13239/g.38208  ORF Transcript_13239/g.38208 Transcript_13239/m.38208 type:complete len:194 (-) Transcript_13239:268-849(-)